MKVRKMAAIQMNPFTHETVILLTQNICLATPTKNTLLEIWLLFNPLLNQSESADSHVERSSFFYWLAVLCSKFQTLSVLCCRKSTLSIGKLVGIFLTVKMVIELNVITGAPVLKGSCTLTGLKSTKSVNNGSSVNNALIPLGCVLYCKYILGICMFFFDGQCGYLLWLISDGFEL